MKMSRYENSVFPYFVHSTVNLPAWRPKDTNVTLKEDRAKQPEEINVKCKKVSETQEVLRNAIRKKLVNHPLSFLLPIQSDQLLLRYTWVLCDIKYWKIL